MLFFLLCLLMTASAEGAAFFFKLWTYRSPWHRVLNAAVSGYLIGLVTVVVSLSPLWIKLAAGAAFGLLYEALNLYWLKIWTFPDEKLLFLKGRGKILLAAGIPWGILPVAAVKVLSWL